MPSAGKYPEPLVFGLDIGTRSIVGTVGYRDAHKFNVCAMAVKFHESRSMVDGQIHDINRVSEDIKCVKEELESMLGDVRLSEVCIAAAGRVLKTAVGSAEYEFNETTLITDEYIHSIDLIGVEKAHAIVREELDDEEERTKFYCVGYTVIKYYLNDIEISNLEGHRGSRIAADVLATFLPEEVVTSLYAAVEKAGLRVSNLTLEPIAAINVAIPERYRMLNIALIDIGAGTSDICITKEGSIIGYGMIPAAGDELTEILVKKYLIDFDTAESLKTADMTKKQITYKDIMGIAHKITPEEIRADLKSVEIEIAGKIADKIIELNGGETVAAAFVVGGGGKFEGFVEMLAEKLELPKERVALRGKEVMNEINFLTEDVKKDSLYVTPIGIALSSYDAKNNFIFVNVNGERIKLYNNDKLTMFDAAVQYGLSNDDLFPKRGADLTFKVNGKTRIARGMNGEAAIIKKNGEVCGMNARIEPDDEIDITRSTKGDDAEVLLSALPEAEGTLTFRVNSEYMTLPKFALVNGKPETGSYRVKDGDEIEMLTFYTVEQLLTYMDISTARDIRVNNSPATEKSMLYDNFSVDWTYSEQGSGYAESYDSLPQDDENIASDVSDSKTASHSDIRTGSAGSTDVKAEPERKTAAQHHPGEPVVLTGSDVPETSVETKQSTEEGPKELNISINGNPVTMKGKSRYTFVDIFDYFEFDLTTVRGSHLVTDIDGRHADYTEELNEGAVIDVHWEK